MKGTFVVPRGSEIMSETRNGGPARRMAEKSSLFGVVSFRPGLAVVLAFLTLTIGLVAFRITWNVGFGRMEGVAREAIRLFDAARLERDTGAPRDPAEIEEKILKWTGTKIRLPREEDRFRYQGVARDKVDKQAAAAVRLTVDENFFLLVVVRPKALSGAGSSGAVFTESFVSGEKDGKSFVAWEAEGVLHVLVSDADLTQTFDLVRRYFT